MKRFLLLMVGAMMIIGCEPSIRYSSAPRKPVAETGTGHVERESDGSERTTPTVDVGRMQRIIEGYLGTPYRAGGYGKLGVDCSGLVYAVYRDYGGLHLPPVSRKLFERLQRVSYRNLVFGDLVFFSLGGDYASHVGIYVGDGKFVHASKSYGVIVSTLDEEYYRGSYVGARRVLN